MGTTRRMLVYGTHDTFNWPLDANRQVVVATRDGTRTEDPFTAIMRIRDTGKQILHVSIFDTELGRDVLRLGIKL